MIPTFRLLGYFCIGISISGIFSHAASLSQDFIPIGLLFLGLTLLFSSLIGLGSYFLREKLGAELYVIYLFIVGCIFSLLIGGLLFWY